MSSSVGSWSWVGERMAWGRTLVLGAALLCLAASGTVIEQVVAVVDQEVITETELIAETRIALIIREGTAGLLLAEGALRPDLVEATRGYLIDQILIDGQVRRLGANDVPEELVDTALDAFREVFASKLAYEAFCRRFGIAESTIRDILRRDLSNEAYLAQRMQAWTSGARDDAERQARAKKALERWLSDLRNGAAIRLIGPTGELERQ